MFAPIRTLFASCRYYFVKQSGTWTCTMCGETR